MASGRKRPSSSNRRGMYAIAGVVAVLLIVLMIQSQKLAIRNRDYQIRKDMLEAQRMDEEVRSGEIENLADYVNSDEYIEKAAREKLGLVYKDEIIFKSEG